MGHRNAWKTSFKSVIGKFTNEAQINAPEENLTKALVLAKSVQDESQQAEDTLPQRWQDLFAEDETKAKMFVDAVRMRLQSNSSPVQATLEMKLSMKGLAE